MTATLFRGVGWLVDEADGTEAGIALTSRVTDLVVIGAELSQEAGSVFAKRVRDKEGTGRLPIVHLSPTVFREPDSLGEFTSWADGFLEHPISRRELIIAIRGFLKTRQVDLDRERLLLSERAARSDVERLNRVKDEFLAVLSHELRTPLHAIVGWCEVLKLIAPEAPEVMEGVTVIDRNAAALGRMIGDLLDITRIMSGTIQLNFRPIDLSELLATVVSSFEPEAAAKNISIGFGSKSRSAQMLGDPARMKQVIGNLLSNAIKFTPRGGSVIVGLRQSEFSHELTITDNGEGIGELALPFVFDNFKQADASESRVHGGLGIGLTVARKLLELHGATISCESAGIGQGTTFVISFPVSEAALLESSSNAELDISTQRSNPMDSLRGIRILIVDDEQDARQFLKRILSKAGAEVRDADGATKGLAAIREFSPQILLSDLGMPYQDGFEFMRQVRASGYQAERLPAIALTAFARPEDRQRALHAGFQEHVSKPVNPTELLATIGDLISTDAA